MSHRKGLETQVPSLDVGVERDSLRREEDHCETETAVSQEADKKRGHWMSNRVSLGCGCIELSGIASRYTTTTAATTTSVTNSSGVLSLGQNGAPASRRTVNLMGLGGSSRLAAAANACAIVIRERVEGRAVPLDNLPVPTVRGRSVIHSRGNLEPESFNESAATPLPLLHPVVTSTRVSIPNSNDWLGGSVGTSLIITQGITSMRQLPSVEQVDRFFTQNIHLILNKWDTRSFQASLLAYGKILTSKSILLATKLQVLTEKLVLDNYAKFSVMVIDTTIFTTTSCGDIWTTSQSSDSEATGTNMDWLPQYRNVAFRCFVVINGVVYAVYLFSPRQLTFTFEYTDEKYSRRQTTAEIYAEALPRPVLRGCVKVGGGSFSYPKCCKFFPRG